MKFTILTVNPHGDGYTHLYLDNNLICQGDYYHDKIEDYIKGYIQGYTHAYNVAQAHEITQLKIEVENIGFDKDEWEYENFSAEEYLEDTIKRLEKDSFIRVENE